MALPAHDDFHATIHIRAHDDLGRSRLDWPESLILEAIRSAYGPAIDEGDAVETARLHARCLRALVDGDTDRSGLLRVKLVACCAARRIGFEAIADADHAFFGELVAIVQTRFRNSPRLRLHFIQRLHEALGSLTTRSPATKSGRAPLRDLLLRPSRQATFAFAG